MLQDMSNDDDDELLPSQVKKLKEKQEKKEKKEKKSKTKAKAPDPFDEKPKEEKKFEDYQLDRAIDIVKAMGIYQSR